MCAISAYFSMKYASYWSKNRSFALQCVLSATRWMGIERHGGAVKVAGGGKYERRGVAFGDALQGWDLKSPSRARGRRGLIDGQVRSETGSLSKTLSLRNRRKQGMLYRHDYRPINRVSGSISSVAYSFAVDAVHERRSMFTGFYSFLPSFLSIPFSCTVFKGGSFAVACVARTGSTPLCGVGIWVGAKGWQARVILSTCSLNTSSRAIKLPALRPLCGTGVAGRPALLYVVIADLTIPNIAGGNPYFLINSLKLFILASFVYRG